MIDETITGNELSSSTLPINTVSEVIIEDVEGGGQGRIWLQEKSPNGAWVDITSKSGGYIVGTPDLGIEYRFRAQELIGSKRVYFGA